MPVDIFSTTEPSIKRLSPATFKLVKAIKTLKRKTRDCVTLGIQSLKIVILSVEEITKKRHIAILAGNKGWINPISLMKGLPFTAFKKSFCTNPREKGDHTSKGPSCSLESLKRTLKSYRGTVLSAWLDIFPPLRDQSCLKQPFRLLYFVGLNTLKLPLRLPLWTFRGWTP